MKAFIAIFVVIFVAGAFGLTEEQKAKGLREMTTCMVKEKVTEAEIKKLIEGDFSNDSRNLRCFISCFLEGVGFADSTGNLLPDVVVEKLSTGGERENIQKAVDACKGIEKDDKCEKLYEIFKCYHAQHAKLH